jgi:hypothetical protein
MKKGDKVYAAHEFMRKIEIEEAEIVSVGPKEVRIKGSGERRYPGLAFGCASRHSVNSPLLAPSRRAALEFMAKSEGRGLRSALASVERSKARIAEIEAALAKEPTP